jgi:hypothetical protein
VKTKRGQIKSIAAVSHWKSKQKYETKV